MARRYFPIAVHQILARGGNVFLLRRSEESDFFPGTWWLPAGHHDGGETIEAAAAREAYEEAGVKINPIDERMICVSHTQTGPEAIHFFCVTSKFEGEPYNAEPDKATACGWFDINALPSPLPEFVARAIKDGLSSPHLIYHPLEMCEERAHLYG